MFRMKRSNKGGFTLIERVPRLILGRCSLLKCRPYQYPVQVGSLTTRLRKQFFSLMRSDKVSERKPFAPIDEKGVYDEIYFKACSGYWIYFLSNA